MCSSQGWGLSPGLLSLHWRAEQQDQRSQDPGGRWRTLQFEALIPCLSLSSTLFHAWEAPWGLGWEGGAVSEVSIKGFRHLKITRNTPFSPRRHRHSAGTELNVFARCPHALRLMPSQSLRFSKWWPSQGVLCHRHLPRAGDQGRSSKAGHCCLGWCACVCVCVP